MSLAFETISRIIEERHLKTVFQPIVSLRDGNVLAYEALTRVTMPNIKGTVEDLFVLSHRHNLLWELEYTTRQIALENASQKIFRRGKNTKLFLNVNPIIIQDGRFKSGFTKNLSEYLHIEEDDIVFEITEKNSAGNLSIFAEVINHYKEQGFTIAVDDMGSGYSGLNLISQIAPQYIKLDMELTRGIAGDRLKQALIRGFVEFSSISNVMLIAEGIETQEELETLTNLGVQYGQGYYIQRPEENIREIDDIFLNILKQINIRKNHTHCRGISDIYIRNLCTHIHIASPEDKIEDLYAMYAHHADFGGLCILDQGMPIGTVTRERFFHALGGAFGFSLRSKKPVTEIMDRDFLAVDEKMTIDLASGMAMERPSNKLYDFIVVLSEQRYLGVVTVKNLLLKTTEIEVSLARHQNPLSGLPGNFIIEQKMTKALTVLPKFSVAYIDLDNFKAYNDAYGFENGDCVLRLFADKLRDMMSEVCFIGHVGGDDFVAIVEGHVTEDFFADALERFELEARYFYKQTDIKKGYIMACGREESVTYFPLIGVTCVVANSWAGAYRSVNELGEHLAGLKKEQKMRKRHAYLQEIREQGVFEEFDTIAA